MSKHSAAKPSFSTKAEQAVAKFGTDAPMKRAVQPEENRAGLRVYRRVELLELHNRRDPADHRRL